MLLALRRCQPPSTSSQAAGICVGPITMSIALQNHVITIIIHQILKTYLLFVYNYSVGLSFMSTQKLTTVDLAKYHCSPSLNRHSSSMNRRPPPPSPPVSPHPLPGKVYMCYQHKRPVVYLYFAMPCPVHETSCRPDRQLRVHKDSLSALGIDRYYARINSNISLVAPSQEVIIINNVARPNLSNNSIWEMYICHIYFVPLDMKGCMCHFKKWQIHPFISRGTTYHFIKLRNSPLQITKNG